MAFGKKQYLSHGLKLPLKIGEDIETHYGTKTVRDRARDGVILT